LPKSNEVYNSKQQANERTTSDSKATMSHTIANAECTGVFIQEKYKAYSFRYNMPKSTVYREGLIGDYHLFVRSGDKVYMEVKRVGMIVISYAELQQNKYWRFYYELSLLLAKDKHKVIKNEAFNKDYDEIYDYTGNKIWSLDTAYIDIDLDKNYKIIPGGNVCYYNINPFEIDKMEYTSQQGLKLFRQIYICRSDVSLDYFLNKSVLYKNIVMEYVMNENKKHILNLATLNSKYCMNDDILTKIYNNINVGGKYEFLTSKEESNILILVE
jgi:hypothetical protein